MAQRAAQILKAERSFTKLIYITLFIAFGLFLHVSPHSLVGAPFLPRHFLINGVFRLSRPKAGDGTVRWLGHLGRNTAPCCQHPVGSRARRSPALCLCSPSVKHTIFLKHGAVPKHITISLSGVMRYRLSLCVPLCMAPPFIQKKKNPPEGLTGAVRCNCQQ